jgi:RNA polymerase sigma-70 factor (ECF subfamily)
MNAPMDDAQILELIKDSRTREQGYRMLMSSYQERLYWHIRKMVGVHEDTDDVLQNTFIKVFKHIGSFKGNSNLFTWIFRIATNESINLLNNRKKVYALSAGSHDLSAANNLRAESWTNGEVINAKLNRAIEQLPAKQKMVFELRYYQEMPYAEMSEKLNTSVGGLKALFHHAVKKVERFVLETSM